MNVFHCQLLHLHHLPFCKPLNLDALERGQMRSELARLHVILDAIMVDATPLWSTPPMVRSKR